MKREYIRLADTLQHELETFRGKPFKRPVTTAVYTREQYKSVITQTAPPLTPAQKKRYNDILKAEGLLRRNADYYAGLDSMYANETGGFYKDGSDSIYVILEDKVSSLSDDDLVALFHELTHAMQDQYIDLRSLDSSVQSSDQSYGVQYALEGEAELFSFYFLYRLWYDVYPSTSQWVMGQFDTMAVLTNKVLDSLHNAGEPLLLQLPFYWAYYSCGPRFINAVVGRDWRRIDANIYPLLPFTTHPVLHPEVFPVEYKLDFDTVAAFIDSSLLYEVDELGEVLMNVLFREWNFPDYLQLSRGLLADDIIAYRTPESDSVRTGWYTYWNDAASSAAFFTNIAALINEKRNITLPGPTQQGDTSTVIDTIDKVYIESNAGHVFVLEGYQPDRLQDLIARMRMVKWHVNNGALAKSTVRHRRHPFIDKSKLVKGGWRRGPLSFEGAGR